MIPIWLLWGKVAWMGKRQGESAFRIAKVAAKHNVPVIALSGVLGKGVEALHQEGIDAFFSICQD